MQELERRVREETDFARFCYSTVVNEVGSDGEILGPMIDSNGETVTECDYAVSFRTPLSLFDDFRESRFLPDEIEDMSAYQISSVLDLALEYAWDGYSFFFDKEVTIDNQSVRYFRTMLTLAGPLGKPPIERTSAGDYQESIEIDERYKDATDRDLE